MRVQRRPGDDAFFVDHWLPNTCAVLFLRENVDEKGRAVSKVRTKIHLMV